MRFESFPIELDANSRVIRSDHPILFDPQRPRSVCIDREAVDLYPACVGLGRDEADMQLVHTVAADRYAVFRCLGGRLEPPGYAPAVGGVGL